MKKRLTEQEIERNMRNVNRAIAQQTLAGLKVSEEAVKDLQRIARGEIETEDAIENIKCRCRSSLADRS